MTSDDWSVYSLRGSVALRQRFKMAWMCDSDSDGYGFTGDLTLSVNVSGWNELLTFQSQIKKMCLYLEFKGVKT